MSTNGSRDLIYDWNQLEARPNNPNVFNSP